MSNDVVYLTKEKRDELEKELNYLQTTGRKEMAQKIAEARSHGDLSENADYDAAKDEQGLMELKISKISATLSKSQVINKDEFPDDKVYILSKVKVKNVKMNMEVQYTMVSDAEADFMEGKISITSPIGKALMGKEVGDIVEINLPAGNQQFEILAISK
jgi:transcription elongation factor GreA